MRIRLSTMVPATVERAFELSLDIGTHVDSMSRSGERAVGGVTSGQIGLGESVTWRARHFGITWTMTSVITAMDRPRRFVDEQLKGPFKSFHHLHEFTPEDGACRMVDEIDYEAPFGPLGLVVDRLLLNAHLTRLIEIRNDFIVAQIVKHE